MKDFSLIYNCKNFVMDKTCYKNLENPKYIDPIMTNILKSFQNSLEIETGLSDFLKMCLTVLKVFYTKQKSHIIQYRSYKKFSNEVFMVSEIHFFQFSSSWEKFSFEKSKKTVSFTFKKHASLKKRYVRANQAPFIKKTITKEIMKRLRLRNNF